MMASQPNSTPAQDTPVVSVLIAAFNHAHYLEECVRSVRKQVLRNFEIIVVDDCSTDNTRDVVSALGGQDLRYVRHEANAGPAAARNTGLRIARGRYVALLDADDSMDPDNLSRKVEVFEAHPDVAVVHSAATAVDEKGRAIMPTAGRASNTGSVRVERLFPRILYANAVIASAAVVRKEALERVGGFDARLRRFDDYDLWIRLARSSAFAYIDEPLVRIRVHESSDTWHSYATSKDFEAITAILEKAFGEFPLEEEGLSFRRIYSDRYYGQLGNKVGVIPVAALARLYLDAVRRDPRGALRRPGIKAGINVVASAVLPRRLVLRLRLRRHAKRLARGKLGVASPSNRRWPLRVARRTRAKSSGIGGVRR